ncbi:MULTISPECIES: FecCD family ABC transporter permease [Mumia]|uniref:FecCD family ABC transporter permease n=1 Tax=Mumia xiangluensis TaxID=1678900 RepID=A0ABW1QNV4_9ACTN|nr:MULTISPECIES: iron chelate uptake ABC transporter family permease subunit [Mumia]
MTAARTLRRESSELSGYAAAVVRTRGGRLSRRVHVRSAVVCAVLGAICLVLGVVALGLGEVQLSAADVVRALLTETSPLVETLVVEWRLPRVLLALLCGAALGAGGAIFQSLTRNPLGSPDVIGFDAGAYTGAVMAIVAGGTLAYVVPGALVGGILTALTVYLLAYRRGVQGFRLIVVGIAVTAVLGSLNTYLIVEAELWRAQMAAIWGAGSLNGLDWSDVRVVAVALAVIVGPLMWFGSRLRVMEMGDDAATALGVRVERDRLALIVLGVSLTSVVTAVAGPIVFVSLCAPQIAKRVTRTAGVALVPAAFMGATLLLVCDVVALHAFAPTILPVGLLTVVLGGCYLVWLLVSQARKEIA